MYQIYNTFTGRNASVAVFLTEESAWAQISKLIEMQARGWRLDICIPNLAVRKVSDNT